MNETDFDHHIAPTSPISISNLISYVADLHSNEGFRKQFQVSYVNDYYNDNYYFSNYWLMIQINVYQQ